MGCCKSVAGLGEQGLSGGVNMGAGPERVFKVMRLNEFTKARALFLPSACFSPEDLLLGGCSF